MPEIGEHYCAACGEVHGGRGGKAPDVEIARIMADRDVEVARIARGETRQAVETGAETELAVAEVQAGADVAVAAEMAEGMAGAPAPEPDPLSLADGAIPDAAPEQEPPSIEPSPDSAPAEPSKRKNGGYWG